MRYQRVLLINPPASSFYGALRPPVGQGYIAEVLKQEGIEYNIVDMLLGGGFRHLLRRIKFFEPELLGFSFFSFNYKRTYDLINKVKQETGLPILVGGPHPTLLRETALEECVSIDYAAVSEGEETMLELCQGMDVANIKGLIYRDNNKIIFNGERNLIKDLDALPFPKYENFKLDDYLEEKVIYTSRGCPHSCIYCSAPKIMGSPFRARSAKNVVEEIAYWYEKGYRQFHFLDDNFTYNSKRVYELCDLIENNHLTGIFLRATNGVRADRVNKEMLTRMKEVGLRSIAFGVEGGNNKILNNIKKGETIEQIERSIKAACELDYDVNLTFLIGSPGETWYDFQDSLNLALKYPIFRVQFYNLVPYPRTELSEWLENNKLFINRPEEYLNWASSSSFGEIYETQEMNVEMKRKAFQEGLTVGKKILFSSIQRKLTKANVPKLISMPIAYLLSRDLIQNMLFKKRGLRKLFEKKRLILYTQ